MGNRKHERKPVSIPVQIDFDMESLKSEPLLGQLCDISEGGAGVEIDLGLLPISCYLAEKELSGRLTVLIPDSAKAETLQVQTVWAKTHGGPPALRVGLRFLRAPEVTQRVREVMRCLPLRPTLIFA